jgi:hypothetical protein
VVSTGFSLLRIADGCPAFNSGSGNDSGSAGSPLSLGLIRPATDNGGPAETVALDPRSPAVDAGERECESVVPTDARGFSRAAQDGNLDGGSDGDRCDLGAYEIFSGCQSAPLLLQGFLFEGADSIATEAALSTAPTVMISDSGEVRLFAGDQVSFGTGFSVLDGGALEVNVGSFTCD